MLFPTIDFAAFFAVVFPVAWSLNRFNVARKLFLVLVSYLFYAAWNWRFCLLLMASSAISFVAGLLIERAPTALLRRTVLWITVLLDLALLGFFKYINFLAATLANLAGAVGLADPIGTVEVALPVAISFITFHAISYVVDVHAGRLRASTSPVDLLLYISFFPHLVAGPIVRAETFLPQCAHVGDPADIRLGASVRLILGGLFKKIVLASHLSTLFVDPLYVAPTSQTAFDLWIGLYAYALVIYCDFSAYTDIAIGVANLLGYRFPQNFDQPYRAVSIADFWRRWHITLSTWLREYLYIPLGGNRGGEFATSRNLFITMVLGGLWHGAGWQFIVWGALHGAALVATRALRPWTAGLFRRWPGPMRAAAWLVTLHFVCITWVFFRAGTLDDAVGYLHTLASGATGPSTVTGLTAGLLVAATLTHVIPARAFDRLADAYETWAWPLRVGVPAAVLLAIVMAAPLGVPPFIYFQF